MMEMAMAIKKKRKTGLGFVEDKQKRLVTFSKRRSGLFKKAAEVSVLTGASLAILVFSPSGRPFSFSSSSSSLDSFLDAFLSGASVNGQQHPCSEVAQLMHEISHLERRISIERAAKKIKKAKHKEAVWSLRSEESGKLRDVERHLEETRHRVVARLEEMAAKKQHLTEEARNATATEVTDQPSLPQDPSASSSSLNNVDGDKFLAQLEFCDNDDLGLWELSEREMPSFSSAMEDDEIASLLFCHHQDSSMPDFASIFSS